jgi:hypothetical protein
MTKAATQPVATRPRSRSKAAPIVEAAPTVEVAEGPVCIHRWRIESPNGATSHGVCRYCGAEKEFPNSAEDGLWEREVPQSRWTGRSEWTPSNQGF